jgi:ATP-dependent Clp protease ATP-binding subunit ClpA
MLTIPATHQGRPVACARAGLAQRIVSGDVPSSLQDRLLMALDMGALIAGAKYRCARHY